PPSTGRRCPQRTLLLLGSGSLTRLVGDRGHQGIVNRTVIFSTARLGFSPVRALSQRRTSNPASPARCPGVVSTPRGLPRIKKESDWRQFENLVAEGLWVFACRGLATPAALGGLEGHGAIRREKGALLPLVAGLPTGTTARGRSRRTALDGG